MKQLLAILIVSMFSLVSRAELDDSFSAPNPFVVSPDELVQIRNKELPEELRQKSLLSFAQMVRANAISLQKWGEQVSSDGVTSLCIGETHSDVYRKIIGQHVLPALNFQSLYLEMQKEELDGLYDQFLQKKEVEWLTATFSPILQASTEQGLGRDRLFAIEQTQTQKIAVMKERATAPEEKLLSRDGFIAHNFLQQKFDLGLNVILYGANHCANFDKGLPLEIPMFRRIKNVLGDKNAQSVLVLPLSQRSHPLVSFLTASGVKLENMVLPNFKQIPPESFNYRFEVITYQQNYDTIIFVKDR